ncbi:mucin-3A-like [Haliotis cracherodii]|uniref:mucin-3A-like n=1 Tax=Haliotis cracherodii TaxID=6455 RepID=UPI0039ED696C
MWVWIVIVLSILPLESYADCPSTCNNGGTCNVNVCACRQGYKGPTCDAVDVYALSMGTSVAEGATFDITVTRADSGTAVTLTVATSGVATSGSDYALSASTVEMAVGKSVAVVTVDVIDDEEAEIEEDITVQMTLNTPPSATTIRTVQYMITDNDPLGIALNIATKTKEGSTITFTGVQFTLPNGGANPIPLTMTVRAITAAENTDYTVATSSITINYDSGDAGSRSALDSFVINLPDDELVEPDKTFSIDFTSDFLLTGDVSTSITIENDDPYVVTVADPGVAVEGGTVTLTFTRDSPVGDLTIDINSADGTAVMALDYTTAASSLTFNLFSATAQFTIIDDQEYEPRESFTVTASSPSLKSSVAVTIFIDDNDKPVIQTTPLTVAEGDGTATLTLTRPTTWEALSINYSTTGGSAETDTDFTSGSGTITFAVGEGEKTISVDIVNDQVYEPQESFTIAITSPVQLREDPSTTINIVDDDDETVTLTSFPASYESTSLEVTLQRTLAVDALTVHVTTTDETTTAADFTHLSNYDVTFPIGSLTATFNIDITDDADPEGDEVFTLDIAGPNVAAFATVNATIVDNDKSRSFDCRRKGSACNSSGDVCRPTLPICECVGQPAREGDECNIVTEWKTDSACRQNSCNSNGECQENGGLTSCACFPGYYGDNCEHTYLKAECTKNNMVFYAKPHGDFQGAIYVMDKPDESDCVAAKVPDPPQPGDDIEDDLEGFFVNVTHSSAACGVISPQEGSADIRYTREFMIQYNTAINTGLDQVVTVICRFNKDNLLVSVEAVTINSNLGPFTKANATNTFSPVSLAADIDGSPVVSTSPIRLSKKVCVTLDVPQEFGGLEILDITFNNSLPATPMSWPVYTQGCQASDSIAVLVKLPFYPQTNKRIIRFCFWAFKFVNSFRLTVEVNLRVCVDAGDCDVRKCTSRRKRQSSNEETTVQSTFNIYIPETNASSGQTNDSSTTVSQVSEGSSCRLPFEFLPTVLCLGGLVAALVALCVFLIFRLLHKPKMR